MALRNKRDRPVADWRFWVEDSVLIGKNCRRIYIAGIIQRNLYVVFYEPILEIINIDESTFTC